MENVLATLRESEAKYRALFESMDEGFCIVQLIFNENGQPVDYRYLETNRVFEQTSGMSGALGRTIRELVPDTEPVWIETYGRVALQGDPVRFERWSSRLGRWFDVNAFRVGDPKDARVAILFQDVTERKKNDAERDRLLVALQVERERLEKVFQQAEVARVAAEAANRAKNEFLAVMSHELRTPLNAIGGYVELIDMGLRGPISQQQSVDLSRIQRNQRHLLGLINQVLNYTRVGTGAVHYDLADVVVSEALASAYELILPQTEARHLRYVTGGCSSSARVRADREKLQQILLNLFSNAVKFTEPGGEVRVSCAIRGGKVEISVGDTGVGIPPEKLTQIFDPFVQVDQRLTRVHEGIGLGLAISRDLARGMNGDLTATSTLGAGSLFTLTLPQA